MNANPNLILGLWPVAGVTTVGVTRDEARRTVAAAIDAGITRFDTAFSYGYDGESDRLIGTFLKSDRDRFELIGKVGQRWTPDRRRRIDGSARTLTEDAETSLSRIGVERFDLLMLHSPDPQVPLVESADAIRRLRDAGLAERVGICNATESQRAEFAGVVDCAAIQCPLNLLQPDSLSDRIGPASAAGAECHVYWTLMKGLLAGKITRDHVFAPGDSRPGYTVFQGDARRHAHDVVDQLAKLCHESGKTIAQLSIGWTISQPGVSAALVGARRPGQVAEIAAATPLDADLVARMSSLTR